MNNTPFRIGAALVLALLLASCQTDKKLQYCPGMASVLDAVVVTQFKGGSGTDADRVLYTAKIANVSGSCSFDKQGKTSDSSVDVEFVATRPVASGAATYTVPYFVAVSRGAHLIKKQVRSVAISFDAGQTATTAEDHIDSVSLVTEGDNKPYNYQILVGFQLTKEQYEYNKKTGIFQQ